MADFKNHCLEVFFLWQKHLSKSSLIFCCVYLLFILLPGNNLLSVDTVGEGTFITVRPILAQICI